MQLMACQLVWQEDIYYVNAAQAYWRRITHNSCTVSHGVKFAYDTHSERRKPRANTREKPPHAWFIGTNRHQLYASELFARVRYRPCRILTAILARITNLTGSDAQTAAERAWTTKVTGHRIVTEAEIAAEQLTADQHHAHARRVNGCCELFLCCCCVCGFHKRSEVGGGFGMEKETAEEKEEKVVW